MSLRLLVAVQTAITTTLVPALTNTLTRAATRRGDRGQATAEYALVILGAAAVALLLIAWATSTGKVGTLLNKVIDSVSSRVA